PDDLEQIAELNRVGWPEARAIPPRGPRSGLAELRRRARQFQGAIEIWNVEVRKHECERKRPLLNAEQGLLQIRVNRRELFLGRLLRLIGVRPEPLKGAVLWRIRAHCR